MELRIGSADGLYDSFAWPINFAVSDGGWIYVPQHQAGEIRIFDENGRHLRTIGRRGQGPREYQAISGMGLLGDTLFVANHYPPRIDFFDLGGDYLGSEVRDLALDSHMSRAPSILLPDGRAIAEFPHAEPDSSAKHTLLFDPGNELVDTLFTDRPPSLTITAGSMRYHTGGGPIPRPPVTFLAHDGTRYTTVDWTEPTATRWRFTVTSVQVGGDTLFRREFHYRPVPYPSNWVDSIFQAAVARVSRGMGFSRSEAETAVRERIYLPAYQPPAFPVVHADDGELWIYRSPSQGPPPGGWEVFDRSGNRIAQVDLPSAVTPQVIRGDRLWGIQFDEFLIPYILRYRIHREPVR